MKPLTWVELLQALTVDLIRRVWEDDPDLRRNKWLYAIHWHWFDVWCKWKTDLTMRDVDLQAAEIVSEWEAEDTSAEPVFTEQLEGETPLGGEMRLTAPWKAKEGA